ncbi:MAG: ABC transporter permease [Chloracidobacterium sp.]|nr:ABC transporter permease [Chloracidobacterium sp.]
MLIESLLLAVAGAALGAWLAHALSRFLVAFLSASNKLVFLDLTLDWRVLGFAAGLAILTCLMFGLAPAIRATRMEPGAVMKAGARGMMAGRERFSLRRGLVVAQVALSLVIVAGALLFSRSLGKLLTVDTGFQQDGVLITTVTFRQLNLPPERIPAFKDELLDRLRAIPGVEAAAAGMTPLRGWCGNRVWMDGSDARQGKNVNRSQVGPDYFKTLQIPLLAGRDFDARDRANALKVAIVNEAFAQTFLNGVSQAGRRLWLEARPGEPETSYDRRPGTKHEI